MKNLDADKIPRWIFWFFLIIEIFAFVILFKSPDCKFYQSVFYLITGISVSLGLGSLVTHHILRWLRNDIKDNMLEKAKADLRVWENEERFPELRSEDKRVKAHLDWFLGITERLIFTTFFVFSPSDAIIAMGGWLALKLATGWHKRTEESRPYFQLLIRSLSLSALLGSAISLSFAIIGGLLIKYGISLMEIAGLDGFWMFLINLTQPIE